MTRTVASNFAHVGYRAAVDDRADQNLPLKVDQWVKDVITGRRSIGRCFHDFAGKNDPSRMAVSLDVPGIPSLPEGASSETVGENAAGDVLDLIERNGFVIARSVDGLHSLARFLPGNLPILGRLHRTATWRASGLSDPTTRITIAIMTSIKLKPLDFPRPASASFSRNQFFGSSVCRWIQSPSLGSSSCSDQRTALQDEFAATAL